MVTIVSHNHFFKKAMRLKINDVKAAKQANMLNKVPNQQARAVSFSD